MSAFQFPDPLIQDTTVNPATNTTYKWLEVPGKWVIVSAPPSEDNSCSDCPSREEMNAGDAANLVLIKNNTNAIDTMSQNIIASEGIMMGRIEDNTRDIEALQSAEGGEHTHDSYATKADLSLATEGLPYRLETDKTMRSLDLPVKTIADGEVAPAAAGGEIQLVDNLGFFYNVTFTGRNGIATSSTAAGIEVDGENLMPKSGGFMTGDITMKGGDEATGANIYLYNNGYIRFGYGPTNENQYGGYIFQRDENIFEIGAYQNKTLKFIGSPEFESSPKVPTPAGENRATNKKYVDDKITQLKDRIEILEEAVQTLVSLVPPVDIGNATITSSADLQDGNAAAAQDEMFIMTCNNDGESSYGLRYHWSIKRGNGRISGSTTQQTCTAWCSDSAPSTVEFQCVISHPADKDQTAIATKLVLVADDA